MKLKGATPQATIPLALKEASQKRQQPAERNPKSSLERLIANSENLSKLLTTRKELMTLRFDELSLLHDIRDMVEADPQRFENIQHPAEFRREIRAKILPKYVTPDFIRLTQEKLLNELLRTSRAGADQDALMTAMVFLQSHTDLDLPVEDNPLWEILFNLSIKDGLKFIDVVTVLMEGLDELKITNPEALTRQPIILQKTRQICQWPIFWKLLINHQEILPYEGLISAILRGELMIEIYFDEVVHLPYYLYQLFKPHLNKVDFLSEAISDVDKERQARELFNAILNCIEKDLPFVLPSLMKRIRQILKQTKTPEAIHELEQSIETLKSSNQRLSSNIFLIALIAAKVSMKQYWENQRDQFFFMTILKDPLDSKNYFDYGQILLKQKQYENAYQLFQCATEIDPNGFWGYWGLGIYYDRTRDYSHAEQNYQKGLKIAQQLEVRQPNRYRRELFLIEEDLKRLRQKKVKLRVTAQPQIELFSSIVTGME